MSGEQLSLFDPRAEEEPEPHEVKAEPHPTTTPDDGLTPAAVAPVDLSATSTLIDASQAFRGHMLRQGFSENTIKAFQADLRLFARHMGENRAIGKIAQSDLEEFMTWLRTERRGVPCSPKSYARRLTTLKVFFGPAFRCRGARQGSRRALIHVHPTTPSPEALSDEQTSSLLAATRESALGGEARRVSLSCLITILLQTGIKKGECMEIKLEHIDLSSIQSPVLFVRYEDPRKILKERRLGLGPTFAPAYRQYLREYQPKERLFACTARNLEYVLEEAAMLADGPRWLLVRAVPWNCVVRDYWNGMPADQLRQKMACQ